jgi:hypothetical protein
MVARKSKPASKTKPIPSSSSNNKNGWTALVYMATDNNLSVEGIFSLTEIKESIGAPQFQAYALFDSSAKGIGTRRYNFNGKRASRGESLKLEDFEDKDAESQFVTGSPTQSGIAVAENADKQVNLPNYENSADPNVLVSFLTSGLKKEMGKNHYYLVVLSGHGSGAVGDFLSDDNPPSSMSIPALACALRKVKTVIGVISPDQGAGADETAGRKIDILGMDSCLMSMAEVCCELSDSVSYLVGAEGFTLNAGWPYRSIFTALGSPQAMSPKEVAKMIVQKQVDYYSEYLEAGVAVDLSACDLQPAKMQQLIKNVKDLVGSLTNKSNEGRIVSLKEEFMDAILLAHWYAQSYKFEQYVDLYDFCELLSERLKKLDKSGEKAKDVGDAIKYCGSVREAVREIVPEDMCGRYGVDTQYSNGLSVYFPWSKSELSMIQEYQRLIFAQFSDWGEFLRVYVSDTQRKPRPLAKGKGELWPPISPSLPLNAFSGGGVKVNPELNTKVNPELNTKVNPELNTKVNPELNTKGLQLRLAKVKNPPDQFYRTVRE